MQKHVTAWLLGAALLLGSFAVSTPLVRAAEGWVIANFTSDITIQPDGRVAFRDVVAVDFRGLAKHGIYRDMPYAYREKDGSTSYMSFEVQSIEQDGAPATYVIEQNENNFRIKIGEADQTISGPHTYIISYLVSGALRAYDGFDELYWNITGNEWVVDIEKSAATIRLPTSSILQLSCYRGVQGSAVPCSKKITTGDVAVFTEERVLAPSEGLTVAVGHTKGLVPILAVTRSDATGWSRRPLVPLLASFATVLFLGGILLYRWWRRRGQDYWYRRGGPSEASSVEEPMPLSAHETIVVEYDPPEKLRPGEIGVLKDASADTLDVTATIVDLAVRGYLEITEIPKEGIFGKTDYELRRTKKTTADLMAYEQDLLDGLFDPQVLERTEENLDHVATAREKKVPVPPLRWDEKRQHLAVDYSAHSDVPHATMRVSSLKNKFHLRLAGIRGELSREVAEKGYFHSDPMKIRATGLALGSVVMGLSIWLWFWVGGFNYPYITDIQAVMAGVLAALVVLGLSAIVMSVTIMSGRTARGREAYRQIRGYELYLKNVEQHRQQFFEREQTFMDVLPYVIMFGLTTKVANAMAAMGVKPTTAPAWYHGAPGRAFSMATFSESLGSLSSDLSSTMASAPGGSGSGGGGSSGGGGGGGGGGSW